MPTFEKSAATLAIEQRLNQGEPGQEIDVRTMESICNLPCDGSHSTGWKKVAAVIPRIERQAGLVWKWQRDTMCWRCLTNDEKPGVIHARVRHIRRQSNRVVVVGDTIDFDQLSASERRAAITSMVVAGAIRALTAPQSRKRIQATIADKPQLPNVEALIDACRSRRGGA